MEMDPAVRAAVRTPVNDLYMTSLRPLLQQAVDLGHLRKDSDLEALLALLLTILPNLALLAHTPGLTGPMPLLNVPPQVRRENLQRLIAPLLCSFTPHEA
jgi:hypothetical protein